MVAAPFDAGVHANVAEDRMEMSFDVEPIRCRATARVRRARRRAKRSAPHPARRPTQARARAWLVHPFWWARASEPASHAACLMAVGAKDHAIAAAEERRAMRVMVVTSLLELSTGVIERSHHRRLDAMVLAGLARDSISADRPERIRIDRELADDVRRRTSVRASSLNLSSRRLA